MAWWYLNRDSGADAGSSPRRDRRRLQGVQIQAGIALVCAAWQPGAFPKQSDGELQSAGSLLLRASGFAGFLLRLVERE